MHAQDRLPLYLLDELTPDEALEVESHLETCAACRAELQALSEGFEVLVDALPAAAPPDGAWSAVAERITEVTPTPPPKHASEIPRGFRPLVTWAFATCALLAAGGGIFGWTHYTRWQALQRDHLTVTRWMAHDDVTARALPMQEGEPLGSVLTLPDGRSLLVLVEDPPADRAYQAWGIRGDDTVSLGVVEGRVATFQLGGFDRFWLSLEPPGGSARPTDILGATGLG